MVTSGRGTTLLTKVSQLINPLSGQWDVNLLHSIFNVVDVGRILQIPLSPQGFTDFIGWALTKQGFYTVRSAYHAQWKFQFRGVASGLSLPGTSAMNPVWRTLWKLQIPGKVKIFIWRALHGILPLKSILVNRHVGTSGECPVCHSGPEDVLHLVFTCQAAKEIWQSLGLDRIIDDAISVDRSGSAVLEHLIRASDANVPGVNTVKLKETIDTSPTYR
jgi:hypothetical protein